MKVTIKVPLPEDISMNKLIGKCWQANMKVKDRIVHDVYLLLCEQLGCGFPEVEKIHVKYTLHSPNWLDFDNAEYGVVKVINDCLATAGLVRNDRPSHLEWDRPKVKFHAAERFVIVEIEEIT